MIQYYSITQTYLKWVWSKVTVETISKQLEYVTKGHIATQTTLFKFKTALFFSSF